MQRPTPAIFLNGVLAWTKYRVTGAMLAAHRRCGKLRCNPGDLREWIAVNMGARDPQAAIGSFCIILKPIQETSVVNLLIASYR